MEEEKRAQFFYLNICRAGLLLLALVTIRAFSVHQDTLSFTLGWIGFLLVAAHKRSVEKKLNVSKKHKLMSTGVFVMVLLPLAYWLS